MAQTVIQAVEYVAWLIALGCASGLSVVVWSLWRDRTSERDRDEAKRLGDWADTLRGFNALGKSGRHLVGVPVTQLPGIKDYLVYRAGPAHQLAS